MRREYMQKDLKTALKNYNEQYARDRVSQEKLDFFSENLVKYASDVCAATERHENEEFYKNLLNSFLKNVFYSAERFTINTDGFIDSAIKDAGNLRVIIETKTWQNKNEFPKDSSLICKGLCELILYYLRATRDVTGEKVKQKSKVEVRRLILSNSLDWYIFDANDIEKLCSGHLERQYFKFVNKQLNYADNQHFYDEVSAYLTENQIDTNLDYLRIELSDYVKFKANKSNQSKIDLLYKVFDYHFMLKEAYRNAGKTHVLNTHFYEELLYIMGLKETKDKGKTLIVLDHTITNSIGWQLYKKYTEDKEYPIERSTEGTLELMILWIDRLLFIKLFEGQLIAFNSDSPEYHIFKVLGRKERDNEPFYKQFSEVPYLNSSLFERQDIEKDDYNISDLANDEVKIAPSSVLKKKKIDKLPLLDYLIQFLSSYDFGASGSEQGGIVQGKDIIDASVLGLIFEKINGYKDGSFYTPSYITEYMAKEAMEKLVVDKMNDEFGWNCYDYKNLQFFMSKNISSIEDVNRANAVINNLHIVDPAVGSGHFLVSVLNRLIAIKHELGIIKVHGDNAKMLSNVDIFVSDDTLIVSDPQGNDFKYNKNDRASQNIQETLFEEKRTLIQNCLFGVDINSKAVAICQLRLWIELLKNAYYRNGEMETLPNIDINIKSGNSLISIVSYKLGNVIGSTKTDIDIVIPKGEIKKYRDMVSEYHSTADKHKKEDIKQSIRTIKHRITSQLYRQGDIVIKDNTWIGVDYGDNLGLYEGAFEWAIEFPEVVSDEGRYIGFDCVIGNPPYISLQDIKDDSRRYEKLNYETFTKKGDIYCLFIELGYKLLKQNGLLMYITSNKWLKSDYGEDTRSFISKNSNPVRLIDFTYNVFDSATVVVSIILLTKSHYRHNTLACNAQPDCKEDLFNFVRKNSVEVDYDESFWLILSDEERLVFDKCNQVGTPLSKWDILMNYGIKSGATDAFIIDEETKNKLIEEDSKSAEIITPILWGKDLFRYHTGDATYLINAHNGIAKENVPRINISDYPAIKNWLEQFITKLKKRSDKGDTPYNLRNCAYLQAFRGEKIAWGNLCRTASYTMVEEGVYLNSPANFIVPGDYYLLGALNSKVVDWFVRKLGVVRNGGYFEYQQRLIMLAPIPIPKQEVRNNVEKLVRKVLLEVKENDSKHLETERQIDDIFYGLYGLTEDEIKLIENQSE